MQVGSLALDQAANQSWEVPPPQLAIHAIAEVVAATTRHVKLGVARARVCVVAPQAADGRKPGQTRSAAVTPRHIGANPSSASPPLSHLAAP